MRIVQRGSIEVAALIEFLDGRPKKYRCMPFDRPRGADGKKLNTVDVEAHFDRVEDAAKFLLDNPGSGIRMKPSGSVYYKSISIEIS